MCTLVSPWKTNETHRLHLILNFLLRWNFYVNVLSFLFAYFSSEDDYTGVRVIKRNECGGGDIYLNAGYGSRGQGVCRVQVESSLTATAEGEQKVVTGRFLSLVTAALGVYFYDTLKNTICLVQYLSNPDTNRYLPPRTHTTRAPLGPSGPGPSYKKNKIASVSRRSELMTHEETMIVSN